MSHEEELRRFISKGLKEGHLNVTLDKELLQLLVEDELNELRIPHGETNEMKFYKYAAFGFGTIGLFMIIVGIVLILFTGNLVYALRGNTDSVAFLTLYFSGVVIGFLFLYLVFLMSRRYDRLSQRVSPKK